MTYQEQLLTIEWTTLRFKILLRDNYQCVICRTGKNLNVHHLYYIRGRMAWEYRHELLITLCEKHHKLEHDCLHLLSEYFIKEHLSMGMLATDILMKIHAGEKVIFYKR